MESCCSGKPNLLYMPAKSRIFAFLLPVALLLASTAGAQTPTAPEQKPDTPAAGGPQGDTGPIAVPKKKPEEEKPKPHPATVKNPEGLEDYSIRVNSQLVNVDVSVVTKDGQFIPGLKKENFRVFEDGVPQKIDRVQLTEAPITAVMLVEFASPNPYVNQQYGSFIYDMLNASYVFAQTLKPEDYIALVSYDIKPRMILDFSKDKRALLGAIGSLQIPMFSETNLFDALYDTIDRLEGVEGHKYIVLIGAGLDTFSKLTLDKVLAKVKSTRDITIYAISTGQAERLWLENHGYTGPIANLNFLQADNQMRTFASYTGGRSYFPRFPGEFPEIFRDVAQTVRNQYMVSYRPSNPKQDGSYRKIKVELQAENGDPLVVQNEKGKKMKYQVIHRDGYRAKQVVE